MCKRCVILGGAPIGDYAFVRARLRPDDFVICCDSGLRHRGELGVVPALVLGDFDSHPNPGLPVETIVLPREKDDTDTVFAAREAVRRGFREFLLVGVVGARLDHTLANLSILLWLESQGCRGRILDDHSEMEIVSRQPVEITEDWAYFSLLNISGVARGIRVEEAKYPLENGEITCGYQYGVSNEVLPGCTARVSVGEGRLLLIKVRT